MINFAERLKAARKMRGWSLEELSVQMEGNGPTKQALSKYENGEMLPTEDNLLEICQALSIAPDYFHRKLNLNLGKVRFRKLESYPVKLQDTVMAQTRDFVERYLELEDLLGIKSQFNTKKYTRFKITSPDDVEEAARYIRKEWKLGNDPLYNVVGLLEDNHIKVFETPQDPDKFWGFSNIVPGTKIAIVVLNSHPDVPNDRKRFTALHELGHLVMDLDNFSEKDQETYCNHFAGAMLITKEKLLEEIGTGKRNKVFISELGQLKKQYGISISALLYRLKNCNIISQTLCFSVMNEMKAEGKFKVEPKEYDYKGEESSHRFLQLLLRGVALEVISTSKAAALNNQKLAAFRKLM